MKRVLATIAVLGLVAGLANAQGLEGSYPDGGGPISVTAVGGDVVSAGLSIKSGNGQLLAGTEGAANSGYQFTLLSTANEYTVGGLGAANAVTYASGSSTTLNVNHGAGANELSANWGDGGTQVAFPIEAAAPPVVPEPASGLLALFGVLGLLGFRRRR